MTSCHDTANHDTIRQFLLYDKLIILLRRIQSSLFSFNNLLDKTAKIFFHYVCTLQITMYVWNIYITFIILDIDEPSKLNVRTTNINAITNAITSTNVTRFNTKFSLSRILSIGYYIHKYSRFSYITQNGMRNVLLYRNVMSAMKPDVILFAEILDTPLYRKRH